MSLNYEERKALVLLRLERASQTMVKAKGNTTLKYWQIQTLFAWMGIDSRALLYGLDHVQQVCSKINNL